MLRGVVFNGTTFKAFKFPESGSAKYVLVETTPSNEVDLTPGTVRLWLED